MKKKTNEVIKEIYKEIIDENYKEKVKINEKAFTRKRKLELKELVLIILNSIKRTTKLELDECMEQMKIETEYTKQAFSEARQKIKPLAFTILNDNFIKTYYKENYKTIKGYLLLAIDGSDIEIPNTENLRKEYGMANNQKTVNGIGTARAKASMLYDVLNKIVITSIITKYKEPERKLAVKNIENLKELIKEKQIITFDRGYPSIALLKYLEQNSIKYVMRTSKTFCNEILNVKTQDEVVKIPITKRVLKTAEDMNIDIKEDYESGVETRVVKIVLNTGENRNINNKFNTR